MGLLDVFNSEEGQQALGLLAAAGPRFDGAGFGQRLQEGLGAGARWKKEQQALAEAKQMQEFRAMQMQVIKDHAAQQKLAAQEQARISGVIPSLVRQASPGAPAMNFDQFQPAGTSTGLPAQPPVAAREGGFDMQEALRQRVPLKTIEELQKLTSPKMTVVAQGASLVNEATGKPAFTAPKEQSKPSAIQEYEFAVGQGFKGTYEQWVNTANSLKAPKVAVDMRDPTAVAKAAMSFQNDYRAATKDSFQRAQAYESMLQATKDPSAKGDLTMVYSFIKALDPTSVVREGEISLVEANRSIPDRIKGYAKKLATGESLLPSERQDLLTQAKTLTQTDYRRSRNDVKAYRDNAKRLQLDPETYAPDPYKAFEESTKADTQTFKMLPPANQYQGKRMKSDDGTIYRSDGKQWVKE